MSTRRFAIGIWLLSVLGFCTAAHAAEDLDALARDYDRVASLRQVKDLQRSYAHLAQAGRWNDMAALFTSDARFIHGKETVNGRRAIAEWLTRRGGGRQSLAPGALHTEFIDQPLANLSADGRTAKVRWMGMTFTGDGHGRSGIAGGIYENEYVREGQGWKIAVSHYHAQYTGTYEAGWSNVDGADLPIVPYHFTLDESGVPLPPAAGPAPRSGETLATLLPKIERLNDEDAVRNLQHAYGYYVDRRMWDDVVDLFTESAVAQITGVGKFSGKAGVRQVMERMGPAGLTQGVLNDHLQFDTMVQVLPGGREAIARTIELGMIGDAAQGTQHWEINVLRNRFVKEGGLWKLSELHIHPLMRADYDKGWGDGSRFPNRGGALPALIGASARIAGRLPPATGTLSLAEARRRLALSQAWEGTENVSAAYGYYIDDFQWPSMGGIFAVKGNKHSPFAGYYIGKDRIRGAATAMYGNSQPARTGIAYHWRIQPVIHVATDGRSANLRTRLFQPGTGKDTARSGMMSGMYPNDQSVIEDGIWRLWALEIDEPYFTMAGWKGGWSGVKPKPAGSPRPPSSPLVQRYPPDILMTEMGRRAEGFRGGTGETVEWPGILPMWFHYRNPVSGRVPPYYWPDCVPCELRPESQMTRHGYLQPPSGPGSEPTAADAQEATPSIAGVVSAGTPIQLVKDGFEAVEGPVRDADGGVLFTNNQAGRILRVAPDGSVSTWFEAPLGANALTRNARGEIIATLQKTLAIAVVQPGAPPRVLADKYEGTPFNRPNDLVADRRGNLYFTDTVPLTATAPPVIPSALYQITADGRLLRIASDIARPNGVALSPDERTLYVANTAGEWVYAFELDAKGVAGRRRDFARLSLPSRAANAAPDAPAPAGGADGLVVDEQGRLYVASTVGVQVFSAEGKALGVIALPKTPQNLAFAGSDRSVLFVVGRGAVYRIATQTRGPDRPGK